MAPDLDYEGGPGQSVLTLKLHYEAGGTSYSDELSIDFGSLGGVQLTSFREPGEDIARELKRLGSDVAKI